jgi:uncharacterized protein (DUF1330 family)
MDGEIYVVIEISKVHDAAGLAEYQQGARAQMAARGGVVVARGGDAFAGDPPFGPLLIQKWPSRAAFTAWQESEEYQPLKDIRLHNADLRMAIVQAF